MTGQISNDPVTTLDPEMITMLKELGGEEEPGLFNELVDTFLSDSPARVKGIQAAATAGDARALSEAAHGLKSSSANMGASVLSELCGSLETAGRECRLEGQSSVVEKLLVEYQRVVEALLAQKT